MNRALHGSCHVPVAAYARLDGEHLSLSGLVGSAIDGSIVRAEAQGRGDAPERLGLEVAELLLAQGARALIDAAL
jgi:hydroxymethylbilane synthase